MKSRFDHLARLLFFPQSSPILQKRGLDALQKYEALYDLFDKLRETAAQFIDAYKAHGDVLMSSLLDARNQQTAIQELARMKNAPGFEPFERALFKTLQFPPETKRNHQNEWYAAHRELFLSLIKLDIASILKSENKSYDVNIQLVSAQTISKPNDLHEMLVNILKTRGEIEDVYSSVFFDSKAFNPRKKPAFAPGY